MSTDRNRLRSSDADQPTGVPSSWMTRRPIHCLPGEQPWLKTSNSTMYHQLTAKSRIDPSPAPSFPSIARATNSRPRINPRNARSMENARARTINPAGRSGKSMPSGVSTWYRVSSGGDSVAFRGSAVVSSIGNLMVWPDRFVSSRDASSLTGKNDITMYCTLRSQG
ncbi:hypothetical protein D3C72_1880210 [compost metagenome]